MTVVARVERFFRRDLWALEAESLPWLRRLGLQALRLSIAVVAEFRYRPFDARAAGLVYVTLLSLVPLLAVTFSVLKAFGAHTVVAPLLSEALAPLGAGGQEIAERIVGFVNDLNVGVLGVAGVAALFLTTYTLISRVESAFNTIWHTRQGRAWTRKFTDYLSVLLVGPLLVVTAMGLLASAQNYWLVRRALETEVVGSLAVRGAKIVPLLLLFAGFTFMHKFMPNTRVRPASAAVGGATTALLWNLTGMIFASFVIRSSRYDAIYSSFAILILFPIWLYVSWLVVLIGAQIAFFHQHPGVYRSHMLWRRSSHVARERLGLALLLRITRSHLDGDKPFTGNALSAKMGAPISVVDELLDDFVEGGVLCRLERPAGVALVSAPERIRLSEVLRIIDGRESRSPQTTSAGDETDPIEGLIRRRDLAVEAALDDVTLRSFAEHASGADAENGSRD